MSELVKFIFGKAWSSIQAYPLAWLIGLSVAVLIIALISKQGLDRGEGKMQELVWWIAIGVIIVIVVFFVLRMVEAGKYFF